MVVETDLLSNLSAVAVTKYRIKGVGVSAGFLTGSILR